MVTVTVQRQNEAAEYGLDLQQLAFADLVASGWEQNDAFIMAYGASHWDASLLKRKAKATMGIEGVKNRIKYTQGNMARDMSVGKIDLSKASKEQILKELLQAKAGLEPGTKEWLDINKQIIEVNQLKKDEVKSEDTTVHFYEPLKCHLCSLWLEWKKRTSDENREL